MIDYDDEMYYDEDDNDRNYENDYMPDYDYNQEDWRDDYRDAFEDDPEAYWGREW